MNYIWFLIIVVAIITGAINGRLQDVSNAIIDGAKMSVDVMLYLAGIMAFWLGIMKIAEKSGFVDVLAKLFLPVAKKLFPEISPESEAMGNIVMNVSANALGLSNAATPIGIKAMQNLQEENKNKKSASNAMCTLLAMNTAGFQIIPATVIAILAAAGDKNPTWVIIPTLIVTTIAFLSALVIVKILEKITPPQEVEEVAENV